MLDLVSVIIPAYNCEKTIKNTIKSITSQSYENLEIICVNDGSTDNTVQVIKDIQKNDCRVKLYNKENGGVSSSRNLGIKKAKGKYSIFVDADDYLNNKNCIEDCINIFNKNNCELLIFGMEFFYKESNKKEYKSIEADKCYKKEEIIKDFNFFFYKNLLSSSCGKFFITDIIKNIKFEESIQTYEDYLFVLEYLKKIKKIYISSKIYYTYVLTTSITLSKRFKKALNKEIEFLWEKLNNVYTDLNMQNQLLLCSQQCFLYYLVFNNYIKNLKWDKAKNIICDFMRNNTLYYEKDIIKKMKVKEKIFYYMYNVRNYYLIKILIKIRNSIK